MVIDGSLRERPRQILLGIVSRRCRIGELSEFFEFDCHMAQSGAKFFLYLIGSHSRIVIRLGTGSLLLGEGDSLLFWQKLHVIVVGTGVSD